MSENRIKFDKPDPSKFIQLDMEAVAKAMEESGEDIPQESIEIDNLSTVCGAYTVRWTKQLKANEIIRVIFTPEE